MRGDPADGAGEDPLPCMSCARAQRAHTVYINIYIAQVYMLCTVYIYINIKHRYLYVYKIHPGARGTRFGCGVTGQTLAWQGEGHGQGKV